MIRLVTGTDLAHWANSRSGEENLPLLLRRLVDATAKQTKPCQFRVGEGIRERGFDGVVESQGGSPFVPIGKSVWEVSVRKDHKAKANEDYANRIADADEQVVFVYVTLRRWSTKDDWAGARRQEGKWSDVRVYDADDLEHWLEAAPAVALWLAALLGKQTVGVEDLGQFWTQWSEATTPVLTTGMVLAGRQEAVAKIQAWLENRVGPLVLQGDTRNNSVAFFAAAIHALPAAQREHILSRTAFVLDTATWKSLTDAEDLLLVAGPSVDSAVVSNTAPNRVVLPLSEAEPVSQGAIRIPPASPRDLAPLLAAAGCTEQQSAQLAATARRSFVAFRRRIANVPELHSPPWASPQYARNLLPILLANRWTATSDGDRSVIGILAGTSFDEWWGEIRPWVAGSDAPVTNVGQTWYLSSEEDAWSQIGRFLTPDDLTRLSGALDAAFAQYLPAFDLPPSQRSMAGIICRPPDHSKMLRDGLARTLAILGAEWEHFDIQPSLAVNAFVDQAVATLLSSDDWRIWASLPLEELAEASPDAFLSAVDRGLAGSTPFLSALFTDNDDAGLFSTPLHTELLWALERVAWSEDHLARAAIALAKLTRIDPGGNWANRPISSLRTIFLLWQPQTSASAKARWRAISAVIRTEPEVGWRLLAALLPTGHEITHPTPRPQWRSWAQDDCESVSLADWADGVSVLIQRMLECVGTSGERWRVLIGAIAHLPGREFAKLVEALEHLDLALTPKDDRCLIWHALREVVSDHRSHPNAKWALSVEATTELCKLMNRFEPVDNVGRYAWLFSHRVRLPEGLAAEDYAAHEHHVNDRRVVAINALINESGTEWIEPFVRSVEVPDLLGRAFAQSDSADDRADSVLVAFVSLECERKLQFALGFTRAMRHKRGEDWVCGRILGLGGRLSVGQQALLCLAMDVARGTFEFVRQLGPEAEAVYWSRVTPFCVEPCDLEEVVRALLDHDRVSWAVHLLTGRLPGHHPPVSLVLEVLEAAIAPRTGSDDEPKLGSDGLGGLMEYVSEVEDTDHERLAKLEWALLPVLRFRYHPKTLLREMARQPEFFVEVVCIAFGDIENDQQADVEEHRWRRQRAYSLLESWRSRPLPGHSMSDELSGERLHAWVARSRELLRERGREGPGDSVIGRVLSGVSAGEDGAWPHPAVRVLIEELQSDSFDDGLLCGVVNGEGVTRRAPDAGGQQERAKAKQFDAQAKIVRDEWPRTAQLLRQLRDHYTRRADREDDDVVRRQDLC